jgi:D-alanyl-D-alanine dipeptidase
MPTAIVQLATIISLVWSILVVGNETRIAQDLRDRAILLREEGAASAHDYHGVAIALDSDLSKDPVVPAADFGLACQSIYAREDGLNAPYYKSFKSASKHVHLRKSVAAKLVEVNKTLAPYNAEVYLLDGYRPIALQVEIWDDFVAQARRVLGNPSEEECAHYAGFYCSDPRSFNEKDFRTWPTHSTGGAIDLSLRSLESKQELFFGSVFDDVTDVSHTDYFEKNQQDKEGASIVEARRNRRLLYWAMVQAGFVNYPYEWWHFDWGTQMAVTNSKDAGRTASFGYVPTPATYK